MTRDCISQKKYLTAAQLFDWATKDQYKLWFTGSTGRHRRTEVILPRLVAQKKLIEFAYGKRKVYTVPRKELREDHYLFIDHGLGCTEGLIRFFWAQMNGEIVQERYFAGCGVYPEWGIRYPNGKMLLFEFSTKSDFQTTNKIVNKLATYRNSIPKINQKFGTSSMLVFVLDIEREKVERFVEKEKPMRLPVFFTDYKTFREVPIRKQMTSSIYFWGGDGRICPLRHEHKPETD